MTPDQLFDPATTDTRKPWQRGGVTTDAPGKVRRDHPATAKAAARDIAPRTGTARARVLEAIIATGDTGATDEEMQSLGMNPNTQRPRRVELHEGGYIFDSGGRRPSRSGSLAIVWMATSKGRAWHERMTR